MPVPGLVVIGHPPLQQPDHPGHIQRRAAGDVIQLLGHVQQIAPIAIGHRGQRRPRLRQQRQRPPDAGLRPQQQGRHRRLVQPAQHEHLHPRQNRPVQLETRIGGGRPDQRDRAVLQIGQEQVLLAAVEMMDFVAEQQRADPAVAVLARVVEDLPQIADPAAQRRDRLEPQIGGRRQQPRDRRLAAPRRAPEDHRRQRARRHHPPDRSAFAKQMLLARHLRKRCRPQPVGERPSRRLVGRRIRRLVGRRTRRLVGRRIRRLVRRRNRRRVWEQPGLSHRSLPGAGLHRRSVPPRPTRPAGAANSRNADTRTGHQLRGMNRQPTRPGTLGEADPPRHFRTCAGAIRENDNEALGAGAATAYEQAVSGSFRG